MKIYVAIGTILVGIILLVNSAYTVNEAQQAIVVQFGKIIGKPITTAGLRFKIPFVQDVRYYDKRILSWDGDQEQIPTKDKKYIWVDTTARWRIKDVVKFAETLNNEEQGQGKLDSILDGFTRDTISNHNLVEAVRNSNAILERAVAKKESAEDSLDVIEEEVTGEIERINVGREQLSRQVVTRATKDLSRFGIELIDVQLRRIAYEKSVEEKVYARMISERKRIAEKIRSIGKGEEAKIRGKLNRDLKEIESIAYRTSQEIRGKAEAEAISLYGDTLKRDPAYFRFARTLEAYKKTMPQRATFILSTDSDFLKYLERSP